MFRAIGELKARLQARFDANKSDLARFGSTVNQAFEAFVIAQVAAWFKNRHGWIVEVVNPLDDDEKQTFRLKFSTRGRPPRFVHSVHLATMATLKDRRPSSRCVPIRRAHAKQ